MTIDLPSPAAPAEGTSLPPPRPFGEAHTVTLPVGSRSALVAGGALSLMPEIQSVRVAIVPAAAGALTVTF
jgi:hypothetical protein